MLWKSFTYCLLAVVALAISPTFALAADTIVPDKAITPADNAMISWSAILAGVVVVLVAHMTLSTLGIGIGAAAIDPYNRENPIGGISTGLMAWMLVSGLIALFAGGWIAGRLSSVGPMPATIHGIVVWAIATLAAFAMMATSFGVLAGGAYRVLADGLRIFGSAAGSTASVVPQAAGVAKDIVKENVPQFNWDKIRNEAENLLEEVTDGEVTGQDVENKVEHAKNEVKKVGKRVARNPERIAEELNQLIQKSYSVIREGLNTTDREELMTKITKHTGMTKDEVSQTIEKWEKMYREAKQQYQEALATAEKNAREAADAAATAISRAAVWTFAALTLGFAAAATGGNLGSAWKTLPL